VPRKTGKRRHIPQRTCVGCREVMPKRSMVRIVHSPDGVVIDPTGKLTGRGAYLHLLRPCWESGLKGALANALRAELTSEERERLQNFANTLPEHEPTMNE
jgi:predicted RNA-binding protein YlxR (DUF448 family)